MSRILNLSLILSAHPSLAWAERDFSKLKYRWILSHILEFGPFFLGGGEYANLLTVWHQAEKNLIRPQL